MGIFSVLDNQQAVPPNTPPLPSLPKLSFDYTRRPTVPISPPMSQHDRSPLAVTSSSKNMDDRSNANQTAATAAVAIGVATAPPPPPPPPRRRTQLPSLSSLFGPPSDLRPVQPPFSDMPSVYSAHSPPERSQVGDASSYFRGQSSIPLPPFASVSQPRSTYDGPYAPESAPYPRSMPAPISPRMRDVEQSRVDAGSEVESAGRWSVHHEDRRHEYALGSRDSGYKPAQPQLITQRSSEQDTIYRDQQARQAHAAMGNPPSTPTSSGAAVTSEGIPVKDGLGPKIWTGTHFLPRFVRAAEVPGEGLCYFYDDGSHCKTMIDGEVVNAHWGVTKAGKPRKRLAIACVTCREKKIKCDPDYPRCVQCEKFGRICKFKNAPRGGHNSPGNSPEEDEDSARRMIIGSGPMMGMSAKANDLRRPGSQSTSASLSPRTHMMRPASPEQGPVAKRPRLGYDTGSAGSYTPIAGDRSVTARMPDPVKSSLSWQQKELPRISEDELMVTWKTDPYVHDPQNVMTIIGSFMTRIECTALRFLPPKHFTSWVESNAHRKSPQDQMLIYSILAVGLAMIPPVWVSSKVPARTPAQAILQPPPDKRCEAFKYAQVARMASERSRLCIQLVQTRLALSLYSLLMSRPCDANDMLSAAISSATCLQLNMELECSREAGSTNFPYGLNKAGYEEMRRRTFFSCFVLERVNGLFPSRVSIINTEDIFLRLPIALNKFEELSHSSSPFFDSACEASTQEESSEAGGSKGTMERGMDVTAHLVRVAAIWGDIMTTTHRLAHRRVNFEFDFLSYYRQNTARLSNWSSSLEPHNSFSQQNLERVTGQGETGPFVMMHLLYHLAGLKLNRHIHPRFLQQDAKRAEYVAEAKEHARGLLEVVASLRTIAADLMTPLASDALVESIDVLGAEGAVGEIPALLDRISLAREVQLQLSTTWEQAIPQTRITHDRILTLRRILDHSRLPPSTPIDGCRIFVSRRSSAEKDILCWQMTEPLEARFPREMDAVYSLSPDNSPALGPPYGTEY